MASFVPTKLFEYVAVIYRNNGEDGDPVGGLNWQGSWVEEPGLIPKGYTKRAYGLGDAAFNLLPEVFYADGVRVQRNQIKSGSYIGIAKKDEDGTVNDPFWTGYITEMPSERFKQSATNTLGKVKALRLGHMLDQIPLTRWGVSKNDGSDDDELYLDSPPLANYTTQSGEVIGNKRARLGFLTDSPMFAGNPADCGTADGKYWTRYDLLQHIQQFAYPEDHNGVILITAYGEALTRLQTVVKESIDLSNATMKRALDVLASRQRGFVWDLEASEGVWLFVIRLAYDSTEEVDIDLSEISRDKVTNLSIQDGDGIPYDRIVVEGNPITWMGTLENGNADQTTAPKYFKKGWTDDQGTAYDTYVETNGACPSDSKHEDVYKRWTFNLPDNPSTLKTQHAATGQGTAVLFCQRILYDLTEGTLAVSATDDTIPYFPTARMARTLPWVAGNGGDDDDTRDAKQKAQTTYLPPMMFNQVEGGDVVDVSKTTVAGESIYVDDRGLGMRIRPSLANDNAYALSELEGETPAPIYNWESNAFTIAIESSQRVRLEKKRDGLGDEDHVRKTLTIRGDWHVWACHDGTIVGVDADGDAIRTTSEQDYAVEALALTGEDGGESGTFLLRNDYPAAKTALEEAELWAFRKSVSGTLSLADVGLAENWPICTSIGTITDSDSSDTKKDLFGQSVNVEYEINGAIESISCSLDINAPSVTISFGIPDIPDAAGRSNSVQTTSPKKMTITDTTKRLSDVEKQLQGVPVHNSKGSASTPTVIYEIVDGQTLAPANAKGIKYADPAVTLADDDPTTGGTRTTGMGRAKNLTTGEYVMVVHDVDAPYNAQTAMLAGEFGVSIETATSSGGTVYHRIARS